MDNVAEIEEVAEVTKPTIVEFTVKVPAPDEVGFTGFLDDVMVCLDFLNSGSMSIDKWKQMRELLYRCIDMQPDEITTMFRGWTRHEFILALASIAEAASAQKKS